MSIFIDLIKAFRCLQTLKQPGPEQDLDFHKKTWISLYTILMINIHNWISIMKPIILDILLHQLVFRCLNVQIIINIQINREIYKERSMYRYLYHVVSRQTPYRYYIPYIYLQISAKGSSSQMITVLTKTAQTKKGSYILLLSI